MLQIIVAAFVFAVPRGGGGTDGFVHFLIGPFPLRLLQRLLQAAEQH